MTSIEKRLFDELSHRLPSVPFVAAAGALFGYAYAAASQLPAQQAAQAWAVWIAAEFALLSLGNVLGSTESSQTTIRATFLSISGYIGIDELNRRGLIRERMKMAIIILRVVLIAGLFIKARALVRLEQKESELAC
jgi:hypothetical protein